MLSCSPRSKELRERREETYEKIKYIILDRIKRNGLSTYDRLMKEYEDLCQDIILKSFIILDKYERAVNVAKKRREIIL